MEFKYRAIDNVKPATTSHSPSPVTYLSDQPLQMDDGFSGFRLPLTGEAALQREVEKEQIRREILRRLELEEEVMRELAIERNLGISLQRPLNIQGLVSQWPNSTVMNHVVVGHIGASQPPLTLPPTEINLSPEMGDKDKVIVLAKPDPELYNAKRKAATPAVSETELSAFGLNKKLKQEWSCELCGIKATSESGLNAHLNGKKHKTKEAIQNRKICKSNKNKKSEKIVNVKVTESVVTITELGVNVENDQHQQHPQTCIKETEKEEQLVERVADNDVSATNSKNEKKLVDIMVYKDVSKCQNEEVLEKSQFVGFLESNKGALTEEAGKINSLTKGRKAERLWCEMCQISTFSQAVMEGHMKGKKHTKKMKKFGQNKTSPQSTHSVSQEASTLIKDV